LLVSAFPPQLIKILLEFHACSHRSLFVRYKDQFPAEVVMVTRLFTVFPSTSKSILNDEFETFTLFSYVNLATVCSKFPSYFYYMLQKLGSFLPPFLLHQGTNTTIPKRTDRQSGLCVQ
jgi:hypothetical protein